jgi:hypothetical protein
MTPLISHAPACPGVTPGSDADMRRTLARALIGAATILAWVSLLVGCGPSAERQELVKRLVTAKAAIQAGLTFADLGIQERQIRTAAELANAQISNDQKQSAEAVVYAISQTRAAWQTTLDSVCRLDRDVHLNSYCRRDFQRVFENLGIAGDFESVGKRTYGLTEFVCSDEILGPLLGICIKRIQAAIDALG